MNNRDEKSFNGEDFLRNVSIEQEKSELIDRQNQLEQQKRNSFEENMNYSNNNMPDDDYVDFEEDEEKSKVFDLKLDSNSEKKVSPVKKYIILSVGLLIIFVLIVIGLRVRSNKSEEAKLNNSKIEEQKIKQQEPEEVGNRVNNIEDYRRRMDEDKNIDKKNILLPEQEDYKKPTIEEKSIKEKPKNNDIFELNKKKEEEQERIKKQQDLKIKKELEAERKRIKELEAKKLREKKIVKKEKVIKETKKRKLSSVPPAEEKNLDSTSDLGGYYIQIGAFSKKPNRKFKNNIVKKGYYYKIYEVDVKGKTFYKVLIGPYPVKSLALKVISKVKKEFHNQNAYILKF